MLCPVLISITSKYFSSVSLFQTTTCLILGFCSILIAVISGLGLARKSLYPASPESTSILLLIGIAFKEGDWTMFPKLGITGAPGTAPNGVFT